MKERDLQRACRRWLHDQGCQTIKLTTLARYGEAGWPDHIVLERGGWCWFVEYKLPTKSLTPLQEQRVKWLEGHGFYAAVVRSTEEIRRARECALEWRG